MIGVITLYNRQLGMADVFLVLSVQSVHFQRHSKSPHYQTRQANDGSVNVTFVSSFASAKYLPVILLCLFVSICLSPMMLNQWTNIGTGNANFLFFQGVVVLVAMALGVVEFLRIT